MSRGSGRKPENQARPGPRQIPPGHTFWGGWTSGTETLTSAVAHNSQGQLSEGTVFTSYQLPTSPHKPGYTTRKSNEEMMILEYGHSTATQMPIRAWLGVCVGDCHGSGDLIINAFVKK